MSSIHLHPTKGVNPRLTVCSTCGKDVGLVLLGTREYKETCKSCKLVHYGGADKRKGCGRCGHHDFTLEPIAETEKIPSEQCGDCRKAIEELQKMVDDGGVWVICESCGSTSAIPKEHEMTPKVREALKVPTGPCGAKTLNCKLCDPALNN